MTRTSRIADLCLVMSFLLILFFPIATKELSLGVQTQEMMAAAENRTMAPKPVMFAERFRYGDVRRYPERMQNYLTDTLPFRMQTISRLMREERRLLGRQPVQGIAGKDGWLFYNTMPDEGTVNDFLGYNAFGEEDFLGIFNECNQKRLYFASLGVGYYVFVAPNKATVYPEFLPDAIQASKGMSRREQFMRFYHEHISEQGIPDFIIDPADSLRVRKAEAGLLYYPRDTHWNWTGRIAGGRILLERLRETFPGIGDIPELTMHQDVERAGLAAMSSTPVKFEMFPFPDEDQWDGINVSSDEYDHIYRNMKYPEGMNILLTGDSFLFLYHPMPEAFAFNTVMFHQGADAALPAFEEFSKQERIDIVVEERVERAFFR